MINEEESKALKCFEKAINASHELEPILRLFQDYPELEQIRQREMTADMEDCYGPWCGGEYFGIALRKVLEQWEAHNKKADESVLSKLQKENAKLRAENAELKKRLSFFEGQILRMSRQIPQEKE